MFANSLEFEQSAVGCCERWCGLKNLFFGPTPLSVLGTPSVQRCFCRVFYAVIPESSVPPTLTTAPGTLHNESGGRVIDHPQNHRVRVARSKPFQIVGPHHGSDLGRQRRCYYAVKQR